MSDELRLWHVTVSVAGASHDADLVRDAMERLRHQHAFLHSMRYGEDRAEICYWEESPEMFDAAAMAMRVWTEHRESAGLPAWEIVGLEVLERSVYQRRQDLGSRPHTMAIGLSSPAPVRF